MAKFSKWVHPKTGAVRVYINNLPCQGGAKVWVEQTTPDSFGTDWAIKVFADYRKDTRALRDVAFDMIEAQFGRSVKFAQIAQ